ncbi:MAG TPA: lysophospholipid acyltransferase family protein, partial [Bacteroidota bacterium]|nr:lysophospholipid acyltransferase family protein [Bacteroidota bacterium]
AAFHLISRIHSFTVLKLCGVRVEVHGTEFLEPGKSYIYVSNHASLFDIPAVIAGLPDRVRMVYKKEIHKIPVFGWGMKLSKVYISVARGSGPDGKRSIDDAAEQIRNGSSVLLFAEGTRTHDGKLQAFKRGAFHLAMRAGVPVVPLTINGSYKVLPRNSWDVRPGVISLVLDKPIVPPNADGREEEIRFKDQVQEIISRHYIDQ